MPFLGEWPPYPSHKVPERGKTKLEKTLFALWRRRIKEGHWLLVSILLPMIEHIPVMTKEVIKFLAPQPGQNFIDATCGLGGHSREILKKTAPRGKLLAIDQDSITLGQAKNNLAEFGQRVTFVGANFNQLGLLIREWEVEKIDGILFDLGVSTYQLTSPERGFSFNLDAILDMRMSPESQKISAKDIVNNWDEKSLRRILRNFGEEPFASKIARAIVRARIGQRIEKTNQLVETVKQALPPSYRASRQRHFATSTFRALRMAVNDELEVLKSGLKQALPILSPGGRMVIISFHSLEDRIVKNFFRENTELKVLTPKPVIASALEVEKNAKARSGKLRAAIKI